LARLKPLAYREVRRRLEAAGFVQISQRGSHVKFFRSAPEGSRVAIVPRHTADVPIGTLRSILSQAGITPEEFEHL
jgi:predicted RNA binding protein YcfA (HicA-like mRNA interferase family)